MIVCICHAVSDRTVRQAASHGGTADEIARRTGAGTACGACADVLARLVESAVPCKPDAPCPGCPRAPRSA